MPKFCHKLNITESANCQCGERETIEHYILHCDQYEEAREKLINAVILKVRRTVAKVRQKLSWTDKIILIVGPIDRLTYARKYFIFGKFSNNCQIKIFDHCTHRKFSLSSWKISFLFLKY
jgi:hypothetical protein